MKIDGVINLANRKFIRELLKDLERIPYVLIRRDGKGKLRQNPVVKNRYGVEVVDKYPKYGDIIVINYSGCFMTFKCIVSGGPDRYTIEYGELRRPQEIPFGPLDLITLRIGKTYESPKIKEGVQDS